MINIFCYLSIIPIYLIITLFCTLSSIPIYLMITLPSNLSILPLCPVITWPQAHSWSCLYYSGDWLTWSSVLCITEGDLLVVAKIFYPSKQKKRKLNLNTLFLLHIHRSFEENIGNSLNTLNYFLSLVLFNLK